MSKGCKTCAVPLKNVGWHWTTLGGSQNRIKSQGRQKSERNGNQANSQVVWNLLAPTSMKSLKKKKLAGLCLHMSSLSGLHNSALVSWQSPMGYGGGVMSFLPLFLSLFIPYAPSLHLSFCLYHAAFFISLLWFSLSFCNSFPLAQTNLILSCCLSLTLSSQLTCVCLTPVGHRMAFTDPFTDAEMYL